MEIIFSAIIFTLGFISGFGLMVAIAYIKDEPVEELPEPSLTFYTKCFNESEIYDGEIGDSVTKEDSEVWSRDEDFLTLICEDLTNRGITEPSQMPFQEGIWYSDPNGSRRTYYPYDEYDTEMTTGHLRGLTRDEEEIVWLRIINDRKIW